MTTTTMTQASFTANELRWPVCRPAFTAIAGIVARVGGMIRAFATEPIGPCAAMWEAKVIASFFDYEQCDEFRA